MASGYSAKRFEENRGNRKLCHLNPFEFFDHTGFRKFWHSFMEAGVSTLPRLCFFSSKLRFSPN